MFTFSRPTDHIAQPTCPTLTSIGKHYGASAGNNAEENSKIISQPKIKQMVLPIYSLKIQVCISAQLVSPRSAISADAKLFISLMTINSHL